MIDDTRIRRLYDDHARHLFTYLRSIGWSRPDTEDIIQETFTRVWQHLDRIDPDRNVRPWLFTVARRIGIDMMRKRTARPVTVAARNDDHDPLYATDGGIGQVIDRAVMDDALAVMTGPHREVVVLRHLYDLSIPETAQVLGIPSGTVKSREFYGLRTPSRMGVGDG